MIAIGVALRILHVTDECITPIAKPKCPIWTYLWVSRSEIFVLATDQVARLSVILHDAFAGKARTVIADTEPRHTVHVNHTCISELSLE